MDYRQFYNKEYYDAYATADGAVSYRDNPSLQEFYQHVADKVVEDFHPNTFLDIGCAMGWLVAALRDRGVNAYGIDVSSYAIGQVREDIRPYCRAQSALEDLPEDFPKRYDMVSCIEMIEHLEEPDGLALIKKMCSYTDTLLLSSTPDAKDEPTHFNVQQPEYWVKHFAPYQFLHKLDYDPSYISSQALCFYRADQKQLGSLVEDYEKYCRLTRENITNQYDQILRRKDLLISDLENSVALLNDVKSKNEILISNLENSVGALNEAKSKNEAALERLNSTLDDMQNQLRALIADRDHKQSLYQEILDSKWWKLTKPGRWTVTKCKNALRRIPLVRKLVNGFRLFRETGFSGIAKKIKAKRILRRYIPKNSLSMGKFLSAETAVKQLETKFDKEVKISILVPLYNTPPVFLREMIDSCINQTYRNWELCLADASDSDDGRTGAICAQYTAKDSRIRYQKLSENKGISHNTNAAIEMATGDYISLLDHDDLLHPAALFEVRKAIDQGADFIYTDELTFASSIDDVTVVHLKPDFAIDNLRSNNYICHLSTFRRALLDQAGWFHPECDGSQDYDIILRLTEKAEKIVHVPKILYYWRNHAKSVASDISAKPYCITAAKKALSEHLDRVGIQGEVSLIENMPSFYRIAYKLTCKPLVSIIIPTKDHIEDLDKCLQSILRKTTYPNYEIIVVENNSTSSSTFDYYRTLEKYDNVQVVTWEGKFNYSAINNFGVTFAKGDYYLLLNNDVEIITPKWIEEMLMYAQRSEVGAVGAKLYYPDNTIQHAGLGIGLLTLAGHLHRGFPRNHPGYMGRLSYAQDLSGVTAACMMVKKSVFEEVGGFDKKLAVAFNDVDLCLKIRQAGYLICFTPFAELYHYESKSRGNDMKPEHYGRFKSEVNYFQKKWKPALQHNDPYLNPNFDYDKEDFTIKTIAYHE